jgi:hypothetical protein
VTRAAATAVTTDAVGRPRTARRAASGTTAVATSAAPRPSGTATVARPRVPRASVTPTAPRPRARPSGRSSPTGTRPRVPVRRRRTCSPRASACRR